MNPVELVDGGLVAADDTVDLQGLTITSISLPWQPYLYMSDCGDDGKTCANSGYLIDYLDILARRYNFSYVSYRKADGDWGVLPKSGPLNLSGEWGGVMGSVVEGVYDCRYV